MTEEACLIAEHTSCTQLRGDTGRSVRCLRSNAPVNEHASLFSGAKFGVVDRTLTCNFANGGNDELCSARQPQQQQPGLSPMATQRAVVRQVVRKQTDSFRSVEFAGAGQTARQRQAQRARCQRLLEGPGCGKSSST